MEVVAFPNHLYGDGILAGEGFKFDGAETFNKLFVQTQNEKAPYVRQEASSYFCADLVKVYGSEIVRLSGGHPLELIKKGQKGASETFFPRKWRDRVRPIFNIKKG